MRQNYPAFTGDAKAGLGALFIGFDQAAITKVVVPMTVGGPEDRAVCYKPDGTIVSNFETDGIPVTAGVHIDFDVVTVGGYSAIPRPGASYAAIPLRSVVLAAGEFFEVDLGTTTAVIRASVALNLENVAIRLALRNQRWTLVSQDNSVLIPTFQAYTPADIIHPTTPVWASQYPLYADTPVIDEASVLQMAGAVKTFTYAPTDACVPSATGALSKSVQATLVIAGDVSRLEDFQVPANSLRRVQFEQEVDEDGLEIDISVQGATGVQARFALPEGHTHAVFCVRSGSKIRFFNSKCEFANGTEAALDSLPLADAADMNLRAGKRFSSVTEEPSGKVIRLLPFPAGFYEVEVDNLSAAPATVFLTGQSLGLVKAARGGMVVTLRILVLEVELGRFEACLLLNDDIVSQSTATSELAEKPLIAMYAVNSQYIIPKIVDATIDVDHGKFKIRLTSTVGDTGSLTPLDAWEAAVNDVTPGIVSGIFDILVKDTHERYTVAYGGGKKASIDGSGDGTVRALRLRYSGGNVESAVFLDADFEPIVTGKLIAAPAATVLEPVYAALPLGEQPHVTAMPTSPANTSDVLEIPVSAFVFSGVPASGKVLFEEPGIYEVRIRNGGSNASRTVVLNGGSQLLALDADAMASVHILFNGASVTLVAGGESNLQKEAGYLATRASGSNAGRVKLVTGLPAHGQASVGAAPVVGSYALYFTDVIGTMLTIETLQANQEISVTLPSSHEQGCVILFYDGTRFVAGDPNRPGHALSELTTSVSSIRVNYVAGMTQVLGVTHLMAPQQTGGIVVFQRESGALVPLNISRGFAVPHDVEVVVDAEDLDIGLAGLPAPVPLQYYKEAGVTRVGYVSSQRTFEVDATSGTVDMDLSQFLHPAAQLAPGSNSANAWELAKKFKAAGVPTVCCIPAVAPENDGISYYLPTSFGIYCAMRELSSRPGVHRTVVYVAGETMKCLDKQLFVGMPCFEVASTMCNDNTVSLFALMTSRDQIVVDSRMLELAEDRVDRNTSRAGITVGFSTESTSFCLEDMLGRVGPAGHTVTATGVISIDHNDRDEYNFLIKDYIDMPFMEKVHVMGVLRDNESSFQTGSVYSRAWDLAAQKNITVLLDVSGDIGGVFNIKYIRAYGQLLPVDSSLRIKQWLNGESGALGVVLAASDSKGNAAALMALPSVLSIAATSFENYATENGVTLYSIQSVNLTKSSPSGYTILAEPAPRVLVPLDVFLANMPPHVDPVPTSPVTGRSRSGRRRY
jgi:hypothetical protein